MKIGLKDFACNRIVAHKFTQSRSAAARATAQRISLCLSFGELILLFLAGWVILFSIPVTAQSPKTSVYKEWMLGPFEQVDAVNPILGPNFNPLFFCPIRKSNVRWEARAILGAAAIVKDEKLDLIYHAEDSSNGFLGMRGTVGTFRQGLAESTDGLHFTSRPEPVLYPENTPEKAAEWPGGDEIPRIVEGPEQTYYLYYSAWNRKVTRLSVATSKDLVHWTKHGLIFDKAYDGKYRQLWCKGAAVVAEVNGGRLKAVRIKDKYWMYFGEGEIFAATSDNLIDWKPVELAAGQRNPSVEGDANLVNIRKDTPSDLLVIQGPKSHHFDSKLVEGGVAVLTAKGIVHLYNASDLDSPEAGTWKKESELYYSLGQALYSADDPTKLLDRSEASFLKPDRDFEKLGCTPNVVYLTGIARFKGKWMIYYNGADWMVGVASTP
jgi:predicted GH43/DUF377 family glycosyl hydrolase